MIATVFLLFDNTNFMLNQVSHFRKEILKSIKFSFLNETYYRNVEPKI